MVKRINKGDFAFNVYIGKDVELCPAYSGELPRPHKLFVLQDHNGHDGLSWTSLEQFWADYGMVRMGLDLDKMTNAADNLRENNYKLDKNLDGLIQHLNAETQFDLDGLVHDVASTHASNINNQGMETQVQYLVDELGVEQTKQEIESIIRAKQ